MAELSASEITFGVRNWNAKRKKSPVARVEQRGCGVANVQMTTEFLESFTDLSRKSLIGDVGSGEWIESKSL